GRAEHVAEAAEDERPHGVALVLGQVLTYLAYADEDVEMVETEAAEHFFELSLGDRRAQDLGLHQLVGDVLLSLLNLPLLGREHGIRTRRRLRRRHHLVALGLCLRFGALLLELLI